MLVWIRLMFKDAKVVSMSGPGVSRKALSFNSDLWAIGEQDSRELKKISSLPYRENQALRSVCRIQ
jgi:hypothetical protein